MKFVEASWIAAVKKAVADLKTAKPSSNVVCIVATLRMIRDMLLDDIGAPKDKDDEAWLTTIKESFAELIQQMQKDNDYGFASNASQAAQKAGFKKVDAFAEFLKE